MTTNIKEYIRSKEITFIKPIIGFETYNKFYFEEFKKGYPFFWLKTSNEEVNFILINIYDFFKDYKLELANEDKKIIDFNSGSLIYFGLVTIPNNPRNMTVNLLAPIIVNYKQKIAGQFINLINTYSLREKLIKD